jgi:hypothetical protein
MAPTRFFVGLALIVGLASPGTVGAEAPLDWRYCLALSDLENGVYASAPFRSGPNLSDLERAFETHLDKLGVKHGVAICPRSDTELDALAARDDAMVFHQVRGLSSAIAAGEFEP